MKMLVACCHSAKEYHAWKSVLGEVLGVYCAHGKKMMMMLAHGEAHDLLA